MAVPKILSELTYAVASELKIIREGTITTGSLKNGFTDTSRTESNDYWNKGGFWVLSHALNAAPFGESREVTDFASAAAITLKTDLTQNITAGDRYAMSRRRFPLDVLVNSVNVAYRALGELPQTDESLTTAADTTQYTIPDAACKDLREVWLETDGIVVTARGWYKIPKGEWRQEKGVLYTPQYSEDYVIKLVYMAEPTMLTADGDELSEFVHPDRIVYRAAAEALMWRAERITATGVVNAINQRINYLLDQDQKAQMKWPILAPKKANGLFMVSFTGERDNAADVVTRVGYVHL